jgi:hypothetical protein
MALVQTNQLFPNRAPQYWTPPAVPVIRQGIAWEPLLWTAGAVGLALLVAKTFENPGPVRRCGICDRQAMMRAPARKIPPSVFVYAW